MLANKFILTQKKEFSRIKEKGKFVKSINMGASFVKEGNITKFGFIVSNKISKKAVERNRIKRAMKDGAREFLANTSGGLMMVVFAKPSITGLSRDEIIAETKSVLNKTF